MCSGVGVTILSLYYGNIELLICVDPVRCRKYVDVYFLRGLFDPTRILYNFCLANVRKNLYFVYTLRMIRNLALSNTRTEESKKEKEEEVRAL